MSPQLGLVLALTAAVCAGGDLSLFISAGSGSGLFSGASPPRRVGKMQQL